ncbi:MAG: hypothetical protein OEW19_00795 [Acidobacteriota bacterium]|nr:hypothetical protein [Acidobacteriota bacterium]
MQAFLLALAALACLTASLPAARQTSDLDRLMEQVLARRDDNWKKLQQYVLDERETFDLTGPGGARLYGFRRDYTWFLREGVFIRSPLRVDGVPVGESDRRKAEADWLKRERRRGERQAEARAARADATDTAPPAENQASGADATAATSLEPGFVSFAYFLQFRFEPGRYALVGPDTVDGRATLKIEYYPEGLFREGRTRPNRRARDRDEDIEEKMNKVSLITLWVDRERRQILQYTFDDIDMDFLPGRSIVRVDDVKATMRMGQPFPDVWLPRDIEMRFRMTLAAGSVDARYRVEYHDHRLADVTYKIR